MQSAEELQEALDKSNMPFEDSRPEVEKALYNKQQGNIRQLRQDRYQYERYKARLGTDAPKSFHSFRQVKTENGSAWKYIQLDYRRRNELALNPDLALPNASGATAADAKFTGYLYRPDNPKGWKKGMEFDTRFGYNEGNWTELRDKVISNAGKYPARYICTDEHGSRYEQQQILYGANGRPGNIVVGWKVNENRTWLATLYVKGVKKDGGS